MTRHSSKHDDDIQTKVHKNARIDSQYMGQNGEIHYSHHTQRRGSVVFGFQAFDGISVSLSKLWLTAVNFEALLIVKSLKLVCFARRLSFKRVFSFFFV